MNTRFGLKMKRNKLLEFVSKYGNKWKLISKKLPGRDGIGWK